MVSPITRPSPSNIAEMMPVIAEGTIILMHVCHWLAPRESEASLKALGTLFRASSASVKMVGTAIKARRHPAVSEFNLSSAKTVIHPPSIEIPKNPIRIEGIDAINSIAGLMSDFSLVFAT